MSESVDIEIRGPLDGAHAELVSPGALAFVADLVMAFRPRIRDLLAARAAWQKDCQEGKLPDFLPDTAEIRDADWQVEPLPPIWQQRSVELTGPAQRKTLINGLNAPVSAFMADLDNAQSPVWAGLLDAQLNLRDAVAGEMEYIQENGQHYRLRDEVCPLILRPRSWHLWEKHVYIDGQPAPGALFDCGLFFYHNARELVRQGREVHLYLPKLESYHEARLWREIIEFAMSVLNLPVTTVRVSVLIETLPAAFQMHEILHELRGHAVALNFGRWDYIFSALKCLGRQPGWLLPDRHDLDLNQPFLRACAQLLVATAHRRGVLAIGGVAAQIPIRNDDEANAEALELIRADKQLEAELGFDGAWVAHPDFAAAVGDIFRAERTAVETAHAITREELLAAPVGEISEAGLRNNLAVGVHYLQSWLRGQGCIPLYNLMEDAATVEICRLQTWQWLHREDAVLLDGRRVTQTLFEEVLAEEMDNIEAEVGSEAFDQGRYPAASELFSRLCLAEDPAEFLSLPAYEMLD